ncbi:hypothetical protein QUB75_27335 [Microcoleus sp. K1-B6]|uniref:hypothetical protein n=1 Tax=unclassified Microcoleus TaxID=2642155 RepID=UPI002FD46881
MNPIAFETGILHEFFEVDRVKKDSLTNASIERLCFSVIHLLLAKPARYGFCEEVRQDKKTVLSEDCFGRSCDRAPSKFYIKKKRSRAKTYGRQQQKKSTFYFEPVK